ncbi:MAG TPA: hypothetical protein VN733_08260, partial [Solirubrobacterales bacterium]|nr:hypothetical protein [Solirubrobacterales bacterium]
MSLAILVLGLLVLVAAVSSGLAAKKKGGSTPAALNALVAKTNALPANALAPGKLRNLEKTAKGARRAAAKRPCRAVRDLGRYRRILLGVRVGKG